MLAHKAVKTGYYCPFMNEDSARIVQNCDKCQKVHQDNEESPGPAELSFGTLALRTRNGGQTSLAPTLKGNEDFVSS